ncbi:LysR family transcriptional regulator substrate-binding protein [Streptomyces laurentii]|uniref:LysR family transcriptional regulator substrate-binding protein n=1 Tax=Streptomyces laurentii TaxID=39478 RepID=UPI0034045DD1
MAAGRRASTPLFERGGRLRLNDAGHLLCGYVERALGELEAGRRAVAEAVGDGAGTFMAFGGPPAAFEQCCPAVEIELHQLPVAEMARRLRARDVDLAVASQPITTEGPDSVRLLDEEVALALPVGHPPAGRASVGVEELVGLPLIAPRPGHWQRRLPDQLFAGRGLTTRIVCEGDEAGAIAGLISARLGVGLVPVIARRTISRVPPAWAGVDSPDCRRVLTLRWAQGGRLPAPARLLRDAVAVWGWEAGGAGG